MADDSMPAGNGGELKPAAEVQLEGPQTASGAPQPEGAGGATATPSARSNARTLFYLLGGAILVVLLLLGGAYGWQVWQMRGLERQFALEKSQLSTAQRQALDVQAKDLLRLAARPLAWAVRAELLRGNVSQVDDYFREFVRERGVNSVLLVAPDGKIMLATNRKLETQAADTVLPKAMLDAPDVTLEAAGNLLRLGVPVMGFDRRLGLLVIDYDPAAKR